MGIIKKEEDKVIKFIDDKIQNFIKKKDNTGLNKDIVLRSLNHLITSALYYKLTCKYLKVFVGKIVK